MILLGCATQVTNDLQSTERAKMRQNLGLAITNTCQGTPAPGEVLRLRMMTKAAMAMISPTPKAECESKKVAQSVHQNGNPWLANCCKCTT